MASQPNFGRASALPLSLIAQAVPKLSRRDLEALTERLIDRLDEINTGSGNFVLHGSMIGGPGCYIADGGI